MQRYVTEAIALGMNAQEFARRNGMSRDQGTRLASQIKLRVEGTARTTSHGAIIPDNAAQSLSRISSRMVNALIAQGSRAVEVIEMLNARYEPREIEQEIDGEAVRKMSTPEWDDKDLRRAKWAAAVCWRIISLNRKDGRDLPAGEQSDGAAERNAGPSEPIDRRPQGSHHPSALVIIDAGSGESVSISE